MQQTLTGDLVAAAVAGDMDGVALAAWRLVDMGADRQDVGGDTELGYAVADCLTALEYLDREGLALGAESVAAAAGRLALAS